MGLVVFALLALLVLGLIFAPPLKGWRTQILGAVTTSAGFLLPLATQILGYLQELDWRQYVLSWNDKQNLFVLLIPGVLGLLIIVLRYMTTGPVGTKL